MRESTIARISCSSAIVGGFFLIEYEILRVSTLGRESEIDGWRFETRKIMSSDAADGGRWTVITG